MSKPRLWGPFHIGESPEAVRAAFPQLATLGERLIVDLQLFDCDFEVEFTFDDLGLATAELRLARTVVSQRFQDVLQRVIAGLTVKHGRGGVRQKHGTTLRKRWREPWVEIDLLAVEDAAFPVISVAYRKIAITDAAFRFL